MRRIVFYLYFDPSGVVDEFAVHKLNALRSHAEHIFVVSNGPLEEQGRKRLEAVADTVWTRENLGFDVWAYKEALERFGRERLAAYDELVLANYTFFGPIGSFAPLFDRMDSQSDIDFWGISDHEATVHPAAPDHPLPHHIQSHWIAVRRRMFTSEQWHAYWRDMPMIHSYIGSITSHEGRFTKYFTDAGFLAVTAFPASDYSSAHPIAENTVELLEDGCPIVKRRSFFSDPLYLDRRGVDTRAIMEHVEAAGYPADLALANLARTSEPRVLLTNLGLLEILPDTPPLPAGPGLRIVATGHASESAGAGRLLRRFAHLPRGTRVVLTVPDDRTAAVARDLAASTPHPTEIRVVDSLGGRDIAALLVGCRDLIESDEADLIVRLRSMKGHGPEATTTALWERHLHDNLLRSPGYFANIAALFARYSSLGMVFPPVEHLGRPTLGFGWGGAKRAAQQLAEELGIAVPFDRDTPVAPYGGMFVARPQALRPLLAPGWGYDDFPSPDADIPARQRLEVIVERLLAYAALSQGLHVREVAHPSVAAISYTNLQYKYQLLAAELGRRPDAQLSRIRELKAAKGR